MVNDHGAMKEHGFCEDVTCGTDGEREVVEVTIALEDGSCCATGGLVCLDKDYTVLRGTTIGTILVARGLEYPEKNKKRKTSQ